MDTSLIFRKYMVQAHGRDVAPRSIVLGPFPQFRRARSSHISDSCPHHMSPDAAPRFIADADLEVIPGARAARAPSISCLRGALVGYRHANSKMAPYRRDRCRLTRDGCRQQEASPAQYAPASLPGAGVLYDGNPMRLIG